MNYQCVNGESVNLRMRCVGFESFVHQTSKHLAPTLNQVQGDY